jgi:hypothetical protein
MLRLASLLLLGEEKLKNSLTYTALIKSYSQKTRLPLLHPFILDLCLVLSSRLSTYGSKQQGHDRFPFFLAPTTTMIIRHTNKQTNKRAINFNCLCTPIRPLPSSYALFNTVQTTQAIQLQKKKKKNEGTTSE